jgi:hypothetical protein
MTEEVPPKLFISYSWSNPDHERWVLELATELREAGVDVILDKWDLREGHDAFAFMERMVTDEAIKKVILICDQTYVRKANSRKGGVGTEAQIITSEIYGSQDQSKFVAVIRERDVDGKPLVPAYYSSRIHIDLSDPSRYAVSYEQLVRWIFDKPLYEKPPLGSKPAYLAEQQNTVHMATAAPFRRAIDAIRNGREYTVPALTEYLNAFSIELEKFRISSSDKQFDERFIESIEVFLPYRNELISLFIAAATYNHTEEVIKAFHRFFEALLRYTKPPTGMSRYTDVDFDNFKFIIHEIYLYFVACLIKFERFYSLNTFLLMDFFVADSREPMQTFVVIRWYLKTLAIRNQRLELRRLSLRADLLKERCRDNGIEFDKLMAADLVLFIRSRSIPEAPHGWWPDTLLYVGHFARHFEMFARSNSRQYFDQIKHLLGVGNKDELGRLLEKIEEDPNGIPRWEFDSFNPRVLLGFDQMATKP